MSAKYPSISKDSKGRFFVNFSYQGKRHRVFCGLNYGLDVSPNSYPMPERKNKARELAHGLYEAVRTGTLQQPQRRAAETFQDAFIKSYEHKLSQGLSRGYEKQLRWVVNRVLLFANEAPLCQQTLEDFLLTTQGWSNSTFNCQRRHLGVITQQMKLFGQPCSLLESVKVKRQTESLHKPIDDVGALLADIKKTDPQLHLAAALTYGCLLRPHREIRCIMWGDIDEGLNFIALSGDKVKNKRNRIVPIPEFVKAELLKLTRMDDDIYLFSDKLKPLHEGFFKDRWSRYKRLSSMLKPMQTLYSFRHTGAINVFQKTGSLTTLQQVMGHSSLQVSLTYLRGLEVEQLDVEDMPTLT